MLADQVGQWVEVDWNWFEFVRVNPVFVVKLFWHLGRGGCIVRSLTWRGPSVGSGGSVWTLERLVHALDGGNDSFGVKVGLR